MIAQHPQFVTEERAEVVRPSSTMFVFDAGRVNEVGVGLMAGRCRLDSGWMAADGLV